MKTYTVNYLFKNILKSVSQKSEMAGQTDHFEKGILFYYSQTFTNGHLTTMTTSLQKLLFNFCLGGQSIHTLTLQW